MSLIRPDCARCGVARDCERVAWYAANDRALFGVGWRCSRCGDRKLVVSPLGPSHLGATTCLQCGADGVAPDAPCAHCGASISDVLSADERALPDEALLELARAAFAIGTCRRALTIATFVRQRADEAAQLRADFVAHLDAQPPFT